MDSTLLTGPKHADLEQGAFEKAENIAGDSLGSILYITRNDARRSEVKDNWADSHKPLCLRAETIDAVVREWYETLYPPVQPLPGQLNRRLTEYALDHTTANTTGALAGEPASATLADAFSSRFSLFGDAGVDTADALQSEFAASALDDRIATATVETYRNYWECHTDCVEEWVCTRRELFEAVTEAEKSIDEIAPEIDVVILSGYHEFRPIERRLLEKIVDSKPTIALLPLHQDGHSGVDRVATDALAVYESLNFDTQTIEPTTCRSNFPAITNALYRPDPDPVSVPDTLQWRELPTPEREIRYVARDLKTELANGRDPTDLAVVIPGTEAYSEYVEDTFETFESPFVTTAGTKLNRTYAGSVIHDLLNLAEPDPRAEDCTSLLANPFVDLVDSTTADAITANARRQHTGSLATLLADIDTDSGEAIESLLTELKALRTASVNEATSTIRGLLEDQFGIEEAIEDYASNNEQAVETRAYELIDEVLTSFEAVESLDTDLSPLALFTRAFDGIPIRLPEQSAGGHIEVMGLLDARMRSYEKVYLVGLTNEHFPVTPERPAFFEEMTEAHPRFDTADERLRGRYLFASLLTNVDELTITTPETADTDSAIIRSPVLDELQRVTGIEPTTGVDERIGSREDLQRHIAKTTNKRAAVSHAGECGDLSPGQTKRADRGLQCATNRATAALTEHDAVLDPETVAEVYPAVEREPYSPSRIERYVQCGFKFFAENILNIEEPDDIEVVPTPLETGSYVHAVLEEFYTTLQSDSTDGVDLDDYDRDTLQSHLREIAIEKLEATDFAYEGLFYEQWKAKLFAGLGDGDTLPYDPGVKPHDAPEQGLFASFLSNELTRYHTETPQHFETPFGAGLPDSNGGPFEVTRPDGSTVSIRGYIDRIDVGHTDDQPSLQLYDYKTGSAPYMTTTTGGTTFQLPIYLLAARHVLDADLYEDASLAATYYQVKPPNNLKVPRGIESKFDSQAELRHFLTEIVPERLGQIDDAITNGRFHTTLLDPREAKCHYCEYERACDVRHHRKRQFVEEVQTDPTSYVPLRVRDDADFEAVMSDD